MTAKAAVVEGPGHIRDFSRVPSHVGELGDGTSKRAQGIARTLTEVGLETYVSDNVTCDIWKKLLGNFALSAAPSATDMTSVEVLSVPELSETAFRVLEKALAVAAAVGIELGRGAAVEGLRLITAPGGAGDNKSTLCVDLQGLRSTEVDFIYGTVIDPGHRNGVPVPTLETFAAVVKGLEARNRKG